MTKTHLSLLLLWAFVASAAQAQEAKDFYAFGEIRQIDVQLAQKNWRDVLDSMYINGDDMLLATVSIDGQTYKNAGVRYRGTGSMSIGGQRNALHIKLNYISREQNHLGCRVIKLSNSLRDPSLVREVLGYQIARQYMAAPRANYAAVTVNGEYYGLMVNVEPIDEAFLEANFGSAEGAFFKCSPNPNQKYNEGSGCLKNVFAALVHEEDAACYLENYEMESADGWDKLMELTALLNQSPDAVESLLDVDQVLWMLAFNNVTANLSSYSGDKSQNFYLYQAADGRFRPIIWDMNLAFGSYKNAEFGKSTYTLEQMIELSPMLHADNPYKPLISKLLANPSYRKMYLAHMRTIIEDHFKSGQFAEAVTDMQRRISSYVTREKHWEYSYDEFRSSTNSTIGKRSQIPGLLSFMEERAAFLKKQDLMLNLPPRIVDMAVKRRDRFSTAEVSNFDLSVKVDVRPDYVWLYYRFEDSGPYQKVQMQPEEEGSRSALDFSISLPFEREAEAIYYYVVAENSGAAQYAPTSYVVKPYQKTRAELNE